MYKTSKRINVVFLNTENGHRKMEIAVNFLLFRESPLFYPLHILCTFLLSCT